MNNKSKNSKSQEAIISSILANTLSQKRPSDLIKIANDLETLKNELGSLKEVAKVVGISPGMLRQFLSVKKLTPDVRKLVKERKLDSVTIVHNIRNLSDDEQKFISADVVNGKLTSGDVRALMALKNKLPHLHINELISRILESKDIKVYVAQFKVPSGTIDSTELLKRFEQILGEENIFSFNINNQIGTLEVTKLGLKKLRENAKKNNKSLRLFVESMVKN